MFILFQDIHIKSDYQVKEKNTIKPHLVAADNITAALEMKIILSRKLHGFLLNWKFDRSVGLQYLPELSRDHLNKNNNNSHSFSTKKKWVMQIRELRSENKTIKRTNGCQARIQSLNRLWICFFIAILLHGHSAFACAVVRAYCAHTRALSFRSPFRLFVHRI